MTFETTVALITGLAWPLTVAWVAWLFRHEVREVFRSRNATLKAGPFEFGIEQARVEAEAATASGLSRRPAESRREPGPTTTSAHGEPWEPLDPRIADLIRGATNSPVEAVFLAYRTVEDDLRTMLASRGIDAGNQSAARLAAVAASEGCITPQAANSVQGITVLRNLAAHGRSEEVDAAKALDYLALVDATLYSMRSSPTG